MKLLEDRGEQVITPDLHETDIIADLSSEAGPSNGPEGRELLEFRS